MNKGNDIGDELIDNKSGLQGQRAISPGPLGFAAFRAKRGKNALGNMAQENQRPERAKAISPGYHPG